MRNKLGSNLGAGALLLIALTTFSPIVAQDDDTQSDGGLHFLLELGSWGAQPRGMEYEPASLYDPSGTFGDEIINLDTDSKAEFYYVVDLDAGQNVGHFRLIWYSQSQGQSMTDYRPGDFVFGQIQSHPYGAGYYNDGRSDGFDASSDTKLSDLRFDFSRTAFRSDRFEGRWLVGIRRVQHERNLDTVYHAIAPLQEPFIPPTFEEPPTGLLPNSDEVTVTSDYRGRGLEGGMEFDIWVMKDRIKIETGFAVGVLSGTVDTGYSSRNWVYLFENAATGAKEIMAPPYDFSQELPDGGIVADQTTQEAMDFRLSSSSRSTVSPVMDLYVGVRGRIWKGLEAVLGYRSVFYGNVGVDLRPKITSITPAGTNLVDVTETDRSAEYDGLYFALAYTF